MELKIERLEPVSALNAAYQLGYAIGAAIHDLLHMIF